MPIKADVESEVMERFRANVRTTMKEQGLSISEVARRMSVTREGLSRMLSGRNDCTITFAERVADACDCSFLDLVK